MMKNENGRSMVEMLGVLAIIGVLSVAGIMGYTIAMRKYRANEIAQAISMLAVSAKTKNSEIANGENTYVKMVGGKLPSGVTQLTADLDSENKFNNTLTVKMETTELCQTVLNNIGTSDDNAIYVDKTNGIGCEGTDHLLTVTVQ